MKNRSLSAIRTDLDQIDTAILNLLHKRKECSMEIAHHKEILNLDTHDPEREKAHLTSLQAYVKRHQLNLTKCEVGDFIKNMITWSKRTQIEERIKIKRGEGQVAHS